MSVKLYSKISLFLICMLAINNLAYGQKYKEMMNDNSVNFYDVVKEAEAYFKTIDVNVKGSGYKPFMRWAAANELKYFPTGDRTSLDLEAYRSVFVKNASKRSSSLKTSKSANGWRELGPLSIDKITSHYAAGIGRVEDFAVDPNNERNIYIASRSGGLWRTLDEGINWIASGTDILAGTGVNSLDVDPSDFNHVFIVLQTAQNNFPIGIYESNNGGVSFQATQFIPSNLGALGTDANFRINTIEHHPTISNMLFVGTSRGLFKSTNNFNTWEQVINSGNVVQVEFHPSNSNIVYAYNTSQPNALYKSSNIGGSFSTVSIPGNNNAGGKISVTANATNDIYFASSSGIFKSNNSGGSFTFVSSSLGGVGTDAFAVNSANSRNMIIGGLDAANSTNGGASFTIRTNWFLGDAIHGPGTLEQKYFNSNAYLHADLRVAKSVNGKFYVGSDGTLAKSEDGGVTWKNLMLKNAPGIRENYKLGVSQSNNEVVICGSQDNGTSIKNESGWIESFGADGMEGVILPLNPDLMVASIQFGGRYRTLNGGVSYEGISSTTVNGWWEAPLAIDANDQFKIYDFRNGVHVSTDFGLTYSYVGIPSFLSSNPNNYWWQIRNAEVAQNNSQIIIVSRASEIEKSVNGGVTFTNIKNNLPNLGIEDIAINPNNDNDIIVVNASFQNGQRVYRSVNGGASWSNITFNIGDVPVHSVVVDNTSNPNIYIGTELGVYYKPLNGNSWTQYNQNMPNVAVQELEINYGANTLKAATWGRGLWEFDLIGRDTYPSIENTVTTDLPTLSLPFQGSNQFVTSTINYSGSLTKVEVVYSVNNQLFDNTITMVNVGGNQWKSEVALPNTLQLTDKMFFKVRAVGSNNDASETFKFMYEVREFAYCEASVPSGTGVDYITQVRLGDFVNDSGQSTYTFYDNLEPIQLEAGLSYSVSMQLGFAFQPDDAGVWIDFNKNGIFDNTESVNMSTYVNNVSTGSFVVPADAVAGEALRMRVRNTYNSTAEACGSALGEVEDYIVMVTPGVNQAPSVNFGNQQQNMTVAEGYTSLPLVAEALDVDGTIASVGLYIDGELIRNDTTAPYMWGSANNEGETLGLTEGVYTFLALATDNDGATAEDVFTLTVTQAPSSSFPYCEASVPSGTGVDYITQVRLGDFVNDSGQSTYTFYDNLDPIQLEAGLSYSVSLQLAFAFDLDVAGVWIDFNKNDIFDNEESISMSAYTNNVSTGSFVVPLDAVVGEALRMRVRNAYNTTVEACGSAFGEVEDYTIILAASSNQAPSVNFGNQQQNMTVTEGYTSLPLVAEALDVDGTIASVGLYIDGELIRNDTAAPYMWGSANNEGETLGLTEGVYTFLALATDNDGATAEDVFTLTVTQAPSSSFPYCEASVPSGTGVDYITQVRLGDFVNDSGQSTYTFYDNLDPIQLEAGLSYSVSLQLAFAFDLDVAGVWIDFNKNDIFDNEESISMSAYTNNVSTGSFVVPLDAVVGEALRMRVRNAYNTTVEACGSAFGEVEDYTIILAASSNQAPSVNFGNQQQNMTVTEGYTSLPLVAEALDVDGTIASVGLYIDGELIRNDTTAPYMWGSANNEGETLGLTEGVYTFLALATDNDGATAEDVFTLTVTQAPSSSFPYCEASVPSGTGVDYITQVRLGDFVNDSGQSTYTFYDNLDPIQLEAGLSYSVSLQLAFAFDLDVAGVWIDFNKNDIFDNEESISMSAYTNNVSTGSFVVPLDAVVGEALRMRVRNAYNTTVEACGSAFGEVEDYTIILAASSNQAPSVTLNQQQTVFVTEGYTSLPLIAEALDVDGTIASVGLYIDGVLIRNEITAPYTWGDGNNQTETLGLLAGTYNVSVLATDNDTSTAKDSFTLQVDTVLSVNNEESEDIKFFPNPANSEVFIVGLPNKKVSIQLIDMLGRIVLSTQVTGGNNNSIDISNLGAAAYTILIQYDAVKTSKLLIKSKF